MQDEMFDSLEGEIAKLRRELVDVRAQRDALAAHIEALHGRINALRVGRRPITNLDSRLSALIRMKPTTSLARLKAEWQAEALEGEAGCVMDESVYLESFRREVADPLRRRAHELRRQAEGGE